jgi:hypothetical protein
MNIIYMEIDCHSLVERYLLLKNPLYTFNFPIAILVAIIVFGYSKAYKFSDNSYINQILIPIVALLLCMVFLDMISRAMISESDKERLSKLCGSWLNDPKNKNRLLKENSINMAEIEEYDGHIESFVSNDNENSQEDISQKKAIYASSNKITFEDKEIFDKVKTKFIMNNNIKNNVLGINPKFVKKPIIPQPSNEIECVGNDQSNECHLCSGMEMNPNNLVAPIAGPTWLPQSAESVQNRLKNGNYTAGKCVGEPPFKN